MNADRRAAILINRWIEPVYSDAEEYDGFALIIKGDEGRQHCRLLEEMIADEIRTAGREAME